MENKTLWGSIIIAGLIIVLGGLWAYFTLVNREPELEPVPQEEVGFVPQIINAKHQYRDGTHIIAGEVDLPTPCYLLETGSVVQVREPQEDLAIVQFVATGGDAVCAQVITPARFIVSFVSGENADIEAVWNENPVNLNLIEAGPNENLEEFELFIKG